MSYVAVDIAGELRDLEAAMRRIDQASAELKRILGRRRSQETNLVPGKRLGSDRACEIALGAYQMGVAAQHVTRAMIGRTAVLHGPRWPGDDGS
jgi:hypothetical protein